MKGYFKKFGHGVLLLGLLFFLFSSGKSDQNNEWKKLFNGQNLDGWEYHGAGDAPPTFNVENGTIVGRTLIPFNDGAFMCTKEQFKDFE